MKRLVASSVLLVSLTAVGGALAAWKLNALQGDAAAAASQPEPVESITVAAAREHQHRAASSAIGTVLALRSVTLRNEVAGTVRHVGLAPGAIVERGTVLVALDVAVEEADLQAQQAQLALANATLARLERLRAVDATPELDVDRARAERDVAAAQIARTRAQIARKTMRVPFRARVGLADVHPGQYLNEGTVLTTLQSVDDALHVDFSVPQAVAAALKPGETVEVFAGDTATPLPARVVALDARVDPATRNSSVRARIERASRLPSPGSSVRVSVATGTAQASLAIPASALRKGPAGDHVFVIVQDTQGGEPRLRVQQRAVQVAAHLGDEVLVVQGLKAGEQVATSGSFKLRDAARVALTPAHTAARASPGGGGS